ncbi:hypothetical protein B0J11DRAFT_579388 [Dendryphion nanum]|uniref:Zinc-binding loop region of homing endonuclease domain-containing protein n=1 Tax=Dendryphion nanum TaxID=256645 RepID=A0A9P9DXA4_9PLEO|nr:hypothetical protein B0J11DRAFT_579388 [Dendryphion nanum]
MDQLNHFSFSDQLKRIWESESDNDHDDDDNITNPPKRRPPREIVILDDEDDDGHKTSYKGSGSQTDPILFPEWITGNIITRVNREAFVVNSDDEADDSSSQISETATPCSEKSLSPSQAPEQFPRELLANLHHTARQPDELSQLTPEPELEVESDILLNPLRLQRRTSISSSESLQGIFIHHHRESLSVDDDDNGEISPDDTNDSEAEDDDDDCIIIYEEIKAPQVGLSLWAFHVKEEVKDNSPGLTLSQDTQLTVDINTPTPSQDLRDAVGLPREPTDCLYALKNQALKLPYTDDPTKNATDEFLRAITDDNGKTLLKVRKRLFWHTYWKVQAPILKQRIQDHYYACMCEDRAASECWLYKGPRITRGKRVVNFHVGFKHQGKSEKLTIPIALIGRLWEGLMSNDEKEGVIEHSWHASHLCGNWTCLNPQHIIAEPGSINLSRNPCFADRDGRCLHSPQCLKHLKVDVHSLRPAMEMSKTAPAEGLLTLPDAEKY